MIEERDEEASRIGRVLHDEIGQLLTAAGLQLDALRRLAEHDPDACAGRLTEVQEIFERVIRLVRELSHSLPPSVVDRVGLPFALDRMVASHRSQTSATLRLMQDPRARVPAPIGQAMHRIAACALENAVRHSGSDLIEMFLRPTSRGIVLEIRDRGVGFDVAAVRTNPVGVGIPLMIHSAARANLELNIESSPGNGTIVRILSPNSPGDIP
jgi:signal transduction histidine kinase